jgi:hypothetical protein
MSCGLIINLMTANRKGLTGGPGPRLRRPACTGRPRVTQNTGTHPESLTL